jgi:hypothetical protein
MKSQEKQRIEKTFLILTIGSKKDTLKFVASGNPSLKAGGD